MKPIKHRLIQFSSGVVFFALSMGAAMAQTSPSKTSSETGDPARWYQEDLTPQARFQTSKKEADAAYKDAVTDCKQLEASSRATCLRDARSQWMQDIETAKKKLSSDNSNSR